MKTINNQKDISRNEFMLKRGLRKLGYDWWWHSFTGYHKITKEPKSFFIEFFLCNPKFGEDYPIYGQLKENQIKNIKPSYLMIKAGAWGKNAKQIHSFYGWKQIIVNKKVPFSIEASHCYLDETRTKGNVKVTLDEKTNHPEYMSDEGEISWDLKIEKIIPFNVGYGANKLFRNLQIFEMFWHVEGMKTLYEGTITIDGEEYIVNKNNCYGYADKNWGRDFTSPWVWLSSNNLISKISNKKLNNSVFDIGGGCPKIGPFSLKRKLLSSFYYEGKYYEFNFSKFWTFTRTKFNCYETNTQMIWHIEQKNLFDKIIVDITCEKDQMLFINYEAPNGKKRHNRLFNGGNGTGTIKLFHKNHLIDEIYCENVGCEYGEFDK